MNSPTNKPIISLHLHTTYSVLDGVSNIDQYVKHAKDNGHHALGISDHGWAIGLYELYDKCKKNGLTPLPGVEFYLAPDKEHIFKQKPYDYFHITVWSYSELGYRNLCKLASLSWNQDEIWGYRKSKEHGYKSDLVSRVVTKFGKRKPRITFADLFNHNEGLVVGSGCIIGSTTKCYLQGEFEEADKNLEKLLSVFRGRFFIEIMPHQVSMDFDRTTKQFKKNECNDFSPDGDLQKACNLKSIEAAAKHDIPLLMTLDSHHVDHTEKPIQDLLLQSGDPSGWTFFNSYHLISTEEAWKHWSERYGTDLANQKLFAASVENSHLIADMAKDLVISNKFHQPTPEIPIEISTAVSDPAQQRKLTLMRAIEKHGRMKWADPVYVARLRMEMGTICDNGKVDFSDYFLFLEKWCAWSREHSVLSGAGRGSAGGCLLAYLLKITHLDPIKWNLPFERFLSAARISRDKFPDIDWDADSRDIIVAAIKHEYGDKYAQISTHGTMKIKMALKDVCRLKLGWNSNDSRVASLTRSIPDTPMGVKDADFLLGYTDKEGTQHRGHLEENLNLKRFFETYSDVFEMVVAILGIPKSIGRHASAVVISDEPISNSIPTCVVSGELCTQFTSAGANYVEKAGLIKFDFLTVNTLKFASDAIRLIQKQLGFEVREEKVSFGSESFTILVGELSIEDVPTGPKGHPDTKILNVYELPELADVFADLSAGRTESLFQVSTPGMTAFCRRVKPQATLDISAIVALDRPGPLDAIIGTDKKGDPITMAEAYILRKAGAMPVEYIHPDMEPITKDTFAVIVYQEQLQRALHEIAGYTLEEADYFREVLAKKKKQELEKFIPELKQRLEKKGWTTEQSQIFVNSCIASSAYSFNLAHSAAYAIDVYITAYLKNKFPVPWWTAVLNNAKVEDIKEKGYGSAVRDILVLPHVNGPAGRFDLNAGKIHAPLYLMDGIGPAASVAIQKARGDVPFVSLEDFYSRVDKSAVNSRVFQQLILCGGFELIEPNKTQQELIESHYYTQRVSKLKAGRDKSGAELRAAADAYKAEHPDEAKNEIPALSKTRIELELQKTQALSIYRCDVHEQFQHLLTKYFDYSASGIVYQPEAANIKALRRGTDIAAHYKNPATRNQDVFWCGFLSESDTFQYTDKKTGAQVEALKLHVMNNGDSVECILWPNTFQKYGRPPGKGLIVVMGNVKTGFRPDTYSIFVKLVQEVEG